MIRTATEWKRWNIRRRERGVEEEEKDGKEKERRKMMGRDESRGHNRKR